MLNEKKIREAGGNVLETFTKELFTNTLYTANCM